MCSKMLLLVLLVTAFCEHVNAEEPTVTPQYLDMLRGTGQHEEFARLLGLDDVSLVIPSEGEESHDPMFNKGFSLGDILLTKEQTESSRQAINGAVYTTSKWPYGVMYYTIHEKDFTKDNLDVIRQAISNFNSLDNNVYLLEAGENTRDYVYIFSGNGCWSHLGKTGKAQPLSLQSNGCVVRGIVQHEIIHALGFTHEQNRPDRDDYIRMRWENIPEEWKSQYEKVSSPNFLSMNTYDYYSVMHYGVNAPGTRKPAFDVLQSGIQNRWIGQRQGLTQSDVDKLKKYYS